MHYYEWFIQLERGAKAMEISLSVAFEKVIESMQ